MMLLALFIAAATAGDDLLSREIDPRFLPQPSATLPQGALPERDPITHPF